MGSRSRNLSLMKSLLVIATLGALVAAVPAQTFFGPGGPAATYYGGALFDVTNVSGQDLVLTGGVKAMSSWTGDGVYRLYTKTGSYVGSESTLANWTQWGEVTTNGAGAGNFFTFNVGSTVALGTGQTLGVAIFHVGGSGHAAGNGALGYRNGGGTFDNGALKFTTGTAKGYGLPTDPFGVHSIPGRTWAGELEYAAVPEPASLAALGLGAIAVLRRRRAAK